MNVQQFVGMKLETAKAAALQAGLEVAVVSPGPQSLFCDFRQGRVTFKVQNGTVIHADLG